MKFAVNISQPTRQLYANGELHFDLFKLPSWDHIISDLHPTETGYIHFPLGVGDGNGMVYDFDENTPANWASIKRKMKITDTPLVNIHLAPEAKHHPDIDPRDTSPDTCQRVTERMIADVRLAVNHLGADKVIVENDTGGAGTLDASTLPEVIRTVVEETGCGFLLDLSHARIVARERGMDEKDYLTQLPTHRLREMHLTGIQWLDDAWQARLAASGMIKPERLQRYRNRWMDHLPLTDADWEMTAWALEQIHSGAWSEPWVASCEYGGFGGFFEATMDEAVIKEQFPRLNELIKRKT